MATVTTPTPKIDVQAQHGPTRALVERAWNGGHSFAKSTSQGGLDYHTRLWNDVMVAADRHDAAFAALVEAAEAFLANIGQLQNPRWAADYDELLRDAYHSNIALRAALDAAKGEGDA